MTDPVFIPPTAHHSVETSLARARSAPRLARHLLREWFQHWGAPQHIIDAGELVASELITNAIKYSDAPLIRLRIRWSSSVSAGYVEVWDANPISPRLRDADDLDEDGRGLLLAKAHASEWGQYPAAGGKVVWIKLAAHYVDTRTS
jgi:anti-sigma regulatory factor (Ser/Thr protein kinase)